MGSRTLNITLPAGAAQFVQSKVSSGEYASETDVIEQGLHVLMHEAEALRGGTIYSKVIADQGQSLVSVTPVANSLALHDQLP